MTARWHIAKGQSATSACVHLPRPVGRLEGGGNPRVKFQFYDNSGKSPKRAGVEVFPRGTTLILGTGSKGMTKNSEANKPDLNQVMAKFSEEGLKALKKYPGHPELLFKDHPHRNLRKPPQPKQA